MRRPLTILLAEDDPDDRELAVDALTESRIDCEIRCVEHGEALLGYLRREGAYAADGAAPRPGIVLLDLNMPLLDGFAALQAIKSDLRLRRIPVLVFTTSSDPVDIDRCYELGATAYIQKPSSFDGMVALMRVLGAHWGDFAHLPTSGGHRAT